MKITNRIHLNTVICKILNLKPSQYMILAKVLFMNILGFTTGILLLTKAFASVPLSLKSYSEYTGGAVYLIVTKINHKTQAIIGSDLNMNPTAADNMYLIFMDYSNGQIKALMGRDTHKPDNITSFSWIKKLPDYIAKMPTEALEDLPAPSKLPNKLRPHLTIRTEHFGSRALTVSYASEKPRAADKISTKTFRLGLNDFRPDGGSHFSILSLEEGSFQPQAHDKFSFGCNRILSRTPNLTDFSEVLEENKIWRWNGREWIRLYWL